LEGGLRYVKVDIEEYEAMTSRYVPVILWEKLKGGRGQTCGDKWQPIFDPIMPN